MNIPLKSKRFMFACLLVGLSMTPAVHCVAPQALYSIHDKRTFQERPRVIQEKGVYYLVYKYGKFTFHHFPNRGIRDGKLIFLLNSIGTGRQFPGVRARYAITRPEEVALVKAGEVYWQDPGRVLIKLKVE